MTPSWITKMESSLGLPLPDALRELYAHSDGEASGHPLRLMRSKEVIAQWKLVRKTARLRGSCVFWVGWNNDYAGIYLEGPLLGRIYLWSYEYDYPHESVAYRSVESFVDSMHAAAKDKLDWYQMPTDYYVATDYYLHGAAVCQAAKRADIASDRKAVRQLRKEYAIAAIEDEFDEWYFTFNIMGLTPVAETEAIIAFLDSEDMYVQARACEILGHRRFAPAIERLGHLARHGLMNGKNAALEALGKIGTPEALEAILESIAFFDKGCHRFIAKALEGCGCRVRWEQKRQVLHFEYQLPNADPWHKLK